MSMITLTIDDVQVEVPEGTQCWKQPRVWRFTSPDWATIPIYLGIVKT